MTNNTNNFLKSLKEITQISLKFATVGGLIIGLWQINIQLATQRKDKNMQLFLKQYEETDNISEIRSSLYRDFDLSGANKLLKETKKDVKLKYKKFIIEFTRNNKDGRDRYQKMLILTNYYNGIASCVESELCDRQTAEVLFKTEGRVFFENYYPFFCNLNERWKDRLLENNSVEFYKLSDENESNDFYEHYCDS